MTLFIRLFEPIPPLRGYIARIWAFENPHGIDPEDARLIAPNGCMKLIVPYRKRVSSKFGHYEQIHDEHRCIVVGQMQQPVRIESEAGGGTIGIEFKPQASSCFLRTRLDSLTDRLVQVPDLWDSLGEQLQEQVGNFDSVFDKVQCIQRFLLGRLGTLTPNEKVHYAVSKIVGSAGFISISELCGDIGYTRQHLSRLFAEYVGVSPKEFARIARFQQFYSRINRSAEYGAPDDLYDYYYDQSHFIKEFRQFVGYSPGEYRKMRNDFGKMFYEKDVPFLQ